MACEREFLLLLTPAERERCRDQIAIDKARRARPADEAREAAAVRDARNQAPIDVIPEEKRAYYDAVIASRKAMREGADFAQLAERRKGNAAMAGERGAADVNVGFNCKTRKTTGSFKLPLLPCYVQPPRGPLTEDVGVEPP